MQIRTISEELKKEYGQKIYKLSLSSGCSCPNRDGTIGTGGCTFCSEGGSGDFAAPFLPIDEQIRLARARVDRKIPASIPEEKRRYIAYFQSYTNTYGDPSRLRALYMETIKRPEIAVLSIGTRPDCLPDEIIRMLTELSLIKPVWVAENSQRLCTSGFRGSHEKAEGSRAEGHRPCNPRAPSGKS
jgi:radical SAM protein (TIGR01212 family)